MSSLDYTLEHLDEVVPRTHFSCPDVDLDKTVLMVVDCQKVVTDLESPAHIESVGGAPAGSEVVQPVIDAVNLCRSYGIPIIWSEYGLQGDGHDAGLTVAKWPEVNPGTPDSPLTWGTFGAELSKGLEPQDGDMRIVKHRMSSFYGTKLQEYLRHHGADTLVMVGVTSAQCVVSTAHDAWSRDIKVIVLADTTTAIPAPLDDQPLGYGQHWEALRSIQITFGDILLSSEFEQKLAEAKERKDAKHGQTVAG